MKVKSTIASALACFALAAICSTAQAGDVFEPSTKAVDYSDLNLSSDKGAEVFYGRVRSAARAVCSQFDNREMALTDKWQNCYDHAVASAVAHVNQGKVTALYNAANKSRSAPRLASLR